MSPREGVARQELLERLAGQLIGVGVGLAEDLGMLDVVEGGGDDLAVDFLEADGLEGALAEIDAPNADWLNWHESYLPPVRGGRRFRQVSRRISPECSPNGSRRKRLFLP